jgi:CelD/BcsL family acetyltransferase involved in cellulose biosynthesis
MIEIVRGKQPFTALAPEWNDLYRRARTDNPFLTHAWLSNWLASFGEERHVALLERNGKGLTGAFVAREAERGLEAIDLHTYWSELLCDGDDSCAQMLEHCARERVQRMEIHGPEEEGYRERLARVARGHFVVVGRNPWVMRSIRVGASFDAYLAARDGKTRAELRRKLRRFAEKAPRAHVVAYGARERVEAITVVEAVESESWKHAAGTAISSSEQAANFYRGIFGLAPEAGTPELYALMVDDQPIAFVLGVRHMSRFYALKTSYREPWGDMSPGIVLFCRLIERLAEEQRIDGIELLGRDSRWKREMATDERSFCVYELLADAVPARLYSMAHQHVRPLLARFQKARE